MLKHCSRTSLAFALSFLLHGLAGAILWWAAPTVEATPIVPEPEVLQTAILPPPAPVVTPEPQKIVVAKAEPKVAMNNKSAAEPKPKEDSNAPATGQATEPTPKPASEPPKTEPQPALSKGAPVDVAIKEGGFKIAYDVTGNYKDFEGGGGATFVFNRSGQTYNASLAAKASAFKFNAASTGEVRANTVATTRFQDGGRVSLVGLGKDVAGSQVAVDYAQRNIAFGTSDAAPTALSYDAVYDYLSAMIYIQGALQNSGGSVRNLNLPISKRRTVEIAQVSFAGREDVSTQMGKFDSIPATIVIPSGSIKSIKMWFVPEHNYLPLRIDLEFGKGKANLIARQVS
ncbi:MAG: DUF3108 domain-containing protein [Formosimonas sp.]